MRTSIPSTLTRPDVRRRTAAALAATGLVLSVAACSGGDEEASASGGGGEDQLTVEMNLYSRSLPYFQDFVAGAQERAEAEGVTLNVTYGETDPQLQYDQVQNALTQSPDGVIVVPVDPAALIPVFQQASDGGVPVLTAINDIEEDGWPSVVGHVGKEYTDVGREKAQYLVDTLGGQGTVAMIHGIRGLLFSELQAQGAMEVFAENPGITVIDGPYTGEFSSDAGLAAAENVLTANPDVDALYFDNDDIALGGVLAAQQRGIAMEDIVIIGTDGGEPARQAVAAGELDMTITLCGFLNGKQAMDTLVSFVRDGDEPAERTVEVTSQMVTRDSYEDVEALIASGDC
ncbi:sugar ABC transporter substrate-binding protein [Geodermatophilus sabuli]|uniref:Monosaccharide ABC transporter substrate-binding protein, CUT2 family n=1 Tax=Geodermatophilus sabuli TaxID=1564158 RepID=A0A285EDZ0_9ACTN|nr:sugar ABC transporter substrate-binding protein [Geodermatophilus sabuli]MBB3085301.1 ABC-type sugar transport system substrate-binding protein [Geodermatophilus sabuli]SNX96271.1 monosaccharide ABC transporter substrate-binding protein, CUT2 family [Geodermatophilus sabuli]